MIQPLRPALCLAEEPLGVARDVLRQEADALWAVADRLDDSFLALAHALLECEGNILVTGMGKSGLVGQKLTATLASTGLRAFFLHPAEAVHGDLGTVGPRDCILCLSHSGETPELKQILPFFLERGARLLAITARRASTLARVAQHAILYGDVEEACPIRLAPSTSCIVMMGIGDALAFVLMRLRNVGPEDFQRNHPAGTIGKRLSMVDSVMRQGPSLRIARADQTIREALLSAHRPGRRTGAIMLVDEDGRFVGLFTDSDLARMLERGELAALDVPIADHMTRHPIVLRAGQRLADAIELLKDCQISEIPVLDEWDQPVGIVDITDVVELLPATAA